MKLIGMLDSPYVRRVAISLLRLGLPFEHESVSVFRGIERFAQFNPVLKAPTLVCDDGTALMDSTLILEYAEALARPRSLLPADPATLQRALRVLGLALAATEKSVQIVYERARPSEKRHEPWLERVRGQLLAACDALEAEVAARPLDATPSGLDQAGLTTAVAWHFMRALTSDVVTAERCPRLAAFSAAAEALPEFRAAPHGEGSVGRVG